MAILTFFHILMKSSNIGRMERGLVSVACTGKGSSFCISHFECEGKLWIGVDEQTLI